VYPVLDNLFKRTEILSRTRLSRDYKADRSTAYEGLFCSNKVTKSRYPTQIKAIKP